MPSYRILSCLIFYNIYSISVQNDYGEKKPQIISVVLQDFFMEVTATRWKCTRTNGYVPDTFRARGVTCNCHSRFQSLLGFLYQVRNLHKISFTKKLFKTHSALFIFLRAVKININLSLTVCFNMQNLQKVGQIQIKYQILFCSRYIKQQKKR